MSRAVYKPAASRVQIEKALEMLIQSERPIIVAGGGVINADAAPATAVCRTDQRTRSLL